MTLLLPGTGGIAIPSGSTGIPLVRGLFSNLKCSATGTGANITVTADELVVENSSYSYEVLRAVSLTVAGTANGANGLDTGSLATSTWYSLWVIWNGTTVAGLLSLSATSPTMPSGYTHKVRVGWVRTDGTANKYPLAFKQIGKKVQYKVGAGTNVTTMPTIITGLTGNVSTPTWTAASILNFVPSVGGSPVVDIAHIVAVNLTASAIIIAAPNNSYGSYSDVSKPPPLTWSSGSGNATGVTHAEFMLESANIYYASNSAGPLLACYGWDDNI